MSGNDTDTTLLLNGDGTNGSTSFPDSSEGGSTHTITADGDAQVTTTSPKFGTGSALFDGTGDRLTTPDSSDFQFGTGELCLDTWVWPDSIGGGFTYGIMGQFQDGSNFWYIQVNSGDGLAFRNRTGGGDNFNITQGNLTGWTAAAWNHIACVRDNSDDIHLYLNGTRVATGSYAGSWGTFTPVLEIGSLNNSDFHTGKLDEIRIKKGDDAINNPSDPLYISSGDPADGFTPPTVAYTVPMDATSMTPARLFRPFDATSMTPAKLAKALDATSMATGRLRADGSQSYFFDLRDSADAQEDTNTGTPPTTVFTDVFTGVSDGMHTIYARSVEKFKNLENTINETFVTFRLASGLLEPLEPNEPISLSTRLVAGGIVVLSWNYSTINQEVAPDSFEVYIDAGFDSSVTFTEGVNSYSVTLGPLSETLKTFKVTSKVGAVETTGATIQDTPDSTPPADVPFQFEAS